MGWQMNSFGSQAFWLMNGTPPNGLYNTRLMNDNIFITDCQCFVRIIFRLFGSNKCSLFITVLWSRDNCSQFIQIKIKKTNCGRGELALITPYLRQIFKWTVGIGLLTKHQRSSLVSRSAVQEACESSNAQFIRHAWASGGGKEKQLRRNNGPKNSANEWKQFSSSSLQWWQQQWQKPNR